MPPHDEHCPERGTVVPVPEQVEQVLAMWKPPLSTNVCVPEPPHVPHLDLEAPGLSPEPEQVPQSTTVDTLIGFVVPLQASRKLTPTAASTSSPR